jgi:hypothetical protein
LDTAKTSDSLEHKLYKVGSLIFAYGKEQLVLVLNPFLQWRALPAFGGVNWSGEYAED